MPQINEYSWSFLCFKLSIILITMIISLNFTRKIIFFSKLNFKQFFFKSLI